LFGRFSFGCLAVFRLVVWPVFIRLFGGVLFGYLVPENAEEEDETGGF